MGLTGKPWGMQVSSWRNYQKGGRAVRWQGLIGRQDRMMGGCSEGIVRVLVYCFIITYYWKWGAVFGV